MSIDLLSLPALAGWVALAIVIDLIVGDPRALPHPVVIIGKAISARSTAGTKAAPGGGACWAGALPWWWCWAPFRWPGWGLRCCRGCTLGWGWPPSFGCWPPRWPSRGWRMPVGLLPPRCGRATCPARGRRFPEWWGVIPVLWMKPRLPEARWKPWRKTPSMALPRRCCLRCWGRSAGAGLQGRQYAGLHGGLPERTLRRLRLRLGRAGRPANWLPARLTALCLWLAGVLYGVFHRSPLRWRGAPAATWREAPRHPSPNAGWPEAMVANLLGVQLGGTNVYQGKYHTGPRWAPPMIY